MHLGNDPAQRAGQRLEVLIHLRIGYDLAVRPARVAAGVAKEVADIVDVVAADRDGDQAGVGVHRVDLGAEAVLRALQDVGRGRAGTADIHEVQAASRRQQMRVVGERPVAPAALPIASADAGSGGVGATHRHVFERTGAAGPRCKTRRAEGLRCDGTNGQPQRSTDADRGSS